MYRHEVFTQTTVMFMRHYRASVLSSGLIAMTEIAQTIAQTDADKLFSRSSGLIIAPVEHEDDGMPTIPDESLECDDLEAMVTAGYGRWMRTAKAADYITHVRLLYEKAPSADTMTSSGLYVPDSMIDEEPAPAVYTATPDELEAFEQMVKRINVSIGDTDDVPGNYL